MSRKWKTLTNVLLLVLVAFFAVMLLFPIFSDSFEPDLRFSVADGLQLLVVITAVLLPIYREYWRREEFGPKPNLLIGDGHSFIREKRMVYAQAVINGKDTQSKHASFNNVFICIENNGKEVLLSCEVKITEIRRWDTESKKWDLYSKLLPFNLCWEVDGKRVNSRHIDIKPEDKKYAILGDYKESIGVESILARDNTLLDKTQKANYFWYVEGSEPFNFVESFYPPNEPSMLCAGEYSFCFAVYGNNISSYSFNVYMNWDGIIKEFRMK